MKDNTIICTVEEDSDWNINIEHINVLTKMLTIPIEPLVEDLIYKGVYLRIELNQLPNMLEEYNEYCKEKNRRPIYWLARITSEGISIYEAIMLEEIEELSYKGAEIMMFIPMHNIVSIQYLIPKALNISVSKKYQRSEDAKQYAKQKIEKYLEYFKD